MPQWDVNFNTRVNDTSPELLRLVERIRAMASVIKGIPIPPGVQRNLDALNILRAVRGTTGIEGADLSVEDVRKIMESPANKRVLPESRKRDEQEARNAEEVMYHVADLIEKQPDTPLTENLIREIHRLTTANIDYAHNTPGRYRSHAVVAGDYVPPRSGEQVRLLMEQFVRWFMEGPPRAWDPIIRAVVAHFYVVSIHPFGDGNGRTSRGAESLMLYQAGVNARGFYSLANFYYVNRSQYTGMLDHVRFETKGDLTPFVLFALRGLAQELEDVHSEVLAQVRLISFRDFAREILLNEGKLGTKAGERMFHFLLELGPEPISLKDLRNGRLPLSRFYRKVTSKTLARDMNFLKQQKLMVIEGDQLRANLEIMTRFTAPAEIRKPAAEKRRGSSTRKRAGKK